MNFFDYLKLEASDVNGNDNFGKLDRVEDKIEVKPAVRKTQQKNKVCINDVLMKANKEIEETEKRLDFKEYVFKKGDFIKVIRGKHSMDDRLCGYDNFGGRIGPCDIYAGYYGEIKEYFKGNTTAVVHLDAPNISPRVTIPIKFIEKV